jgi:hypothetical protein
MQKHVVINHGQGCALIGLLVALSACTTTSFNSTWREPTATPVQLQGQRVAAVVLNANDGVRRAAEDALAKELTARGAQGVPSYTLFEGKNYKDQNAVKAAFDKAGISGVVSMRAVGKEQQVTYTPGSWGPSYGSYWGGYYGYGWGAVYDPGYLRTDTIVSVETLVYSLKQDKLIWAAQSQTTSPSSVNSFVHELSGKVADQMRKDGLLRVAP